MNDNSHVFLRTMDPVVKDPGTLRTLNFKDNKVEFLTLEQLKETVDERNTGQKPMNGLLHWELFERLNNRIEESGLEFNLLPIAAADGGASKTPGVSVFPGFQDKYGEGSLQSHLLRRLVGLFLITEGATKEFSYGLAVAFHQEGIQIAYGPNINICANMAIVGTQLRTQTYGPNSITPEKLLEVAGEWITKFEEHRKHDLAILNKMKEIQVGYRDIAELVGHFTFIRVARDSKNIKSKPEYPLNQGQITKFTESYLMKYQEQKQINDGIMSLFEIYNLATALHKPVETDLPQIIPANYALGQLLIDKYKLG
jgi:hypothetical protein